MAATEIEGSGLNSESRDSYMPLKKTLNIGYIDFRPHFQARKKRDVF
jgi:hypothetical protein